MSHLPQLILPDESFPLPATFRATAAVTSRAPIRNLRGGQLRCDTSARTLALFGLRPGQRIQRGEHRCTVVGVADESALSGPWCILRVRDGDDGARRLNPGEECFLLTSEADADVEALPFVTGLVTVQNDQLAQQDADRIRNANVVVVNPQLACDAAFVVDHVHFQNNNNNSHPTTTQARVNLVPNRGVVEFEISSAFQGPRDRRAALMNDLFLRANGGGGVGGGGAGGVAVFVNEGAYAIPNARGDGEALFWRLKKRNIVSEVHQSNNNSENDNRNDNSNATTAAGSGAAATQQQQQQPQRQTSTSTAIIPKSREEAVQFLNECFYGNSSGSSQGRFA